MNTIASLCGYIIVIVIALYTLFCFTAFRSKEKEKQDRVFKSQRVCIFLIQFLCQTVLYTKEYDLTILALYVVQIIMVFATIHIYQIFYKGLSKLVLNNMVLLMMISFIMLERINIDYAIRQMSIAAAGLAVCLLVPIIIKKFPYFDRLGWQYAVLGIFLLGIVMFLGTEKYGAKNWIIIKGFAFQPSEFEIGRAHV